MDIQEIKRYIEVGRGFVEVERIYPEKYKGLCRRTYIRRNEIQVDYCTAGEIELNEGETTFYFIYNNLNEVIEAAEKFIEKPVSEWINYNRTYNEWDFPESDKNAVLNFFSDLQSHRLIFPENFRFMRICDIYALGIFLDKIKPDDNGFLQNRDFIEYLCSLNHEFTEY